MGLTYSYRLGLPEPAILGFSYKPTLFYCLIFAFGFDAFQNKPKMKNIVSLLCLLLFINYTTRAQNRYRDYVIFTLNNKYHDTYQMNFNAKSTENALLINIVMYAPDNYPEMMKNEKTILKTSKEIAATFIKNAFDDELTNYIYNKCEYWEIDFVFYYQANDGSSYDIKYTFGIENIPKLKSDIDYISGMIYKGI